MKKKTFRSALCGILAAAVVTLSPFTAQTVGAVSQKDIDELQKQMDELDQKAQEQQEIINDLTSARALFLNRKIALDTKIELNQQQISLLRSKIDIYDEIIAEKQAELDEALALENAQSEIMRSRMRAMEENGRYSYLSFVFSAQSIPEILSRIADVNDIMRYDQDLEAEYMAAREDVEAIKASFEETRLEQEELSKELKNKQTELDAQIEAAYTLIADIDELSDDAQAEYEAIAEAYADAESEFDALIAKRAAEEAARQAAQQQQQQGGTSGGGTSSGGNSGGGGGSAVSLSSLMWPVPSCNLITSRFGYRTSPTAGASSYHGGLDIGAQQGATIVAAEAGEVILASYNGGYGNCVMIDHGNGIVTLYGHMESIAVGYGQYVSKGQAIGFVGSTGVSTGPHCHFEIRLNGGQTDPAPYFGGLVYYYC